MLRARREPLTVSTPLLAGLLALALYCSTLPAGLTWANNGADGGDLLAAALTGGVPHPTGYPTYQILLRLAIAVYGGEPARAGAWLSAICAALAAALLADLARRIVVTHRPEQPIVAALAGFLAALTFAVSRLLWEQAIVVEVYTLNALFVVALLWLAWRWGEDGGQGWLVLAGLTFGLGLGNHLTLTLTVPGLLLWIWAKGRGRPAMLRDLLAAALATLAGLLVYAYLPLAASTRPPINWGDPVTLDGFLWVVTGRVYAPMPFGLPLSQWPSRLAAWAGMLLTQFMPWGFVLALIGLWQLERRLRAWWAAALVIWLTFTVYALGYNSVDSQVYLIPAFALMALWMAVGLGEVLSLALGTSHGACSRALIAVLAFLVLLVLAVGPALWNWEEHDPRHEWHAWATVQGVRDAGPNAIILTSSDQDTFALWYAVYGLRQRPDVAVVNVDLWGFEWYRRALADTHPTLLPSVQAAPPLEALIPVWLAQRPVYVAEDVGLPLQLGERVPPSAILTQVVGVSN